MRKVALFSKVSLEQFARDRNPDYPEVTESTRLIYNDIRLPERATAGSAGYDFFAPYDITITKSRNHILFPTGIRCEMEPGWVLMLMPKSGLGFKYHMHLANTVGVVDEDYAYANNEGHIAGKLSVPEFILDEVGFVNIKQGEKYMQGIFIPFGITSDDNASAIRVGGFGSTGK